MGLVVDCPDTLYFVSYWKARNLAVQHFTAYASLTVLALERLSMKKHSSPNSASKPRVKSLKRKAFCYQFKFLQLNPGRCFVIIFSPGQLTPGLILLSFSHKGVINLLGS